MTEKQTKCLVAALKATPTAFAQPAQAAALKAAVGIVADDLKIKLPAGFAEELANLYAPFFNASAQLQSLKKLGVIPEEMTAAQKAAADALKAALKA